MRIRRKTKRRIKRLILLSPVILLVWFVYIVVRSPSSAAPAGIKVDMSPARVERGRYLFTALAACDRCHSALDTARLHTPVITDRRAAGRVLDQRGLPGEVTAPNLTPDRETGLGDWSDGEKIRAIREGIAKDGSALYPLMPYGSYRKMADVDVEALVAYLDSLAPIRNPLPPTRVSFFTRVFMKSEPQPVASSVPAVDIGGGVIYGEYLATIAGCEECHTPGQRGKKIGGRRFAGGLLFDTPSGQVVSSNITPDAATGIGKWDFRKFQEVMQQHRKWDGSLPPKAGAESFTVMPWEAYARLKDEDLEALFLYVKSAAPVQNLVETHPNVKRD